MFFLIGLEKTYEITIKREEFYSFISFVLMIKKNLFVLFVFYFFVLQLFIAGVIRGELKLAILGLINLIAIFVVSMGYRFFTRKDKVNVKVKVSETIEDTEIEKETIDEEESRKEISESNIEYIKTKINRTKRKPLAEGSGIYRLVAFLLACCGFLGILYLFWDTFDFITIIVAGIAMMIFLAVFFKVGNLWRKTIFLSGYFLSFLVLSCFGVYATIVGTQNEWIDQLKSEISTFIDEIKGFESDSLTKDEGIGNVIIDGDGFLLTGNDAISSGENLTGITAISGTDIQGNVALGTGENSTEELSGKVVETPDQNNGESNAILDSENKLASKDLSEEVSILDAIKYLVDKNKIVLSSSKSVRFTYMAKSNKDYPYMKTALEKRMIGSNTNPDTKVSCDVYMVMKGLVEGWNIKKTADIKSDYWRVAKSKNALNGCIQGARLTVANL